jgi:DcuC family C4-dicarboxylate transporter
VLPGICILLVFVVAATLMVTRTLPALLALPMMAVSVALVAGLFSHFSWSSMQTLLFDVVLGQGCTRMMDTMVLAIFGGILAQVVMRQGIAPTIVRTAAEYAGDQKLLLAFFMTVAVALNFVSLSGIGAVIMVGSLVLPILIGSGFSANYAGALVLMGIALGGIFNPVNLNFFCSTLSLRMDTVKHYAVQYGGLFAVFLVIYLVIEGRREKGSFAWAQQQTLPPKTVSGLALLTPVLPIALMLIPHINWPPLPAFIVAILFGCLTTQPRRVVPNLTAATLEGLRDTAPVLGLFMGIGMSLKAMSDPVTIEIMHPFVSAILPHSTLSYVAFFGLLAPMTLYRGPLNLYGLGAGFSLLMAKAGLPALAVMVAFMAVGQMQSVCDPTNSQNVWIAQFVRTSTNSLLKSTLAWVWGYVCVALVWAVLFQGVMT